MTLMLSLSKWFLHSNSYLTLDHVGVLWTDCETIVCNENEKNKYYHQRQLHTFN